MVQLKVEIGIKTYLLEKEKKTTRMHQNELRVILIFLITPTTP